MMAVSRYESGGESRSANAVVARGSALETKGPYVVGGYWKMD